MRDDRENRLDELFARARQETPDTGRLEEHFETRFMARLAERKAQTSPWQLLVWQMIPAFAAIAAIVLACSFTVNPTRSSDPFAAITNGHEEQMARNYLLGG
jgi:anti-sigma-K factor RskA